MNSLEYGYTYDYNKYYILYNPLAILLIWRCNYCTSTLVPAFSSNLFLLFFFLWIVLVALGNRYVLGRLLKQGRELICFIVINTVLNLFLLGNMNQETINYIIVFICLAIFECYAEPKYRGFKVFVIILILVDTCVKVIYSIAQLKINPGIVKQMSVAGASDSRVVSILIADYSTVYVCVLIVAFLFYVLLNKKKDYLSFVYLVVICILGYFILKCSFFFALLLLSYGIAATLFFHKKRSFIIFPLMGIIFALLFSKFLGDFCSLMATQNYWSEIIKGKWADMALLLKYGSDAAYMSDMRLDLMKRSWNVFVERPLFGIFSLNVRDLSVGKHSGWLDGLGNYGIIRYSLFLVFLIRAMKRLVSYRGHEKSIYVVSSIYFLLSIVNPNVFPQIWLFFFVLVPFVLDTMED